MENTIVDKNTSTQDVVFAARIGHRGWFKMEDTSISSLHVLKDQIDLHTRQIDAKCTDIEKLKDYILRHFNALRTMDPKIFKVADFSMHVLSYEYDILKIAFSFTVHYGANAAEVEQNAKHLRKLEKQNSLNIKCGAEVDRLYAMAPRVVSDVLTMMDEN